MSSAVEAESYPGRRIGLPQSGPGSLASWRARIAALILDWAASMILTGLFFGPHALGPDATQWQKFMPMVIFFVESSVLGALTNASFGQLLCRITIARLDRRPLGFLRSIPRAALICLVIPPLVVDGDRRGLHDLLLNTAVLTRK